MSDLTHVSRDLLSLVADVGGTNTRVALARGPVVDPATVRRFANAGAAGLHEVLARYLDMQGNPDCDAACAAVAGPVRDGHARLTNIDWSIDRDMLARAARAETAAVLNDLQAQGHALGHHAPGSVTTVVEGADAGPHSAQLVIGVGTGFNASPVYNTESGRYVPPGEAGHATLPVRDDVAGSLSRFVTGDDGFAAIEDVLSGRGLVRCHAWALREAGSDGPPLDGRALVAALAGGTDPVARRAGEIWVRMMGTVAGNLALDYLPFGGVYLIGGVSVAMAPFLSDLGFAEAFRDKGRFGDFMRTFPVRVVGDDYAALTGCASHLAALA